MKEADTELFYNYGGSPGGARPKIFLRYKNEEWMVKFPAGNDPETIGETEYKFALLAKSCGIEMSDVHLFDNRFFGTKRFDRSDEGKTHTLSAAGLLHADYRIPSLDYNDLLRTCFALTKNMEEVYKVFRLMVFNMAIGNKDDHAKNFAFQYKNDHWVFAPAFDLLPSNGFNGNHTTTANGKGIPGTEDLMTLALKNGLDKGKSKKIIDEVLDKVSQKNIRSSSHLTRNRRERPR